MEIKKEKDGFYIRDSEGNALGKITYTVSGEDLITVDSTYVSDELRGQGVAKKLLNELVDWVRKENKKIVPICSYVKAQMDKNEEYHDVKA